MTFQKKRIGPFEVHSAREVYDNRWIRVTEHEVTTPAGTPGIYGVIHYKNRAVAVIPYENGETWLVGQHRFPFDEYSWEVPKGGIPYDEDLLVGARRELREETGLEARHYELIVPRMHLSNSTSDEVAYVYLATGLSTGEAQPEDTEELKLKRVPVTEAFAMVRDGRITDAMSVAGLLKLELLLNTRTEAEASV